MELTVTGARSELGRVLLATALPDTGDAVHINLAGQQANTLLHDGHAWRDFPRAFPAATTRALRTAQASGATRVVHASFAFVHAVEQGARLAAPLRDCVDVILEAEARVLAGPLPATIVRLGYLYGPGSADLLAYRSAFRLGRPYWSGDPRAAQHHLHHDDAAAALQAAARAGKAGRLYHATDGQPLPFATFMDAFARRVGRARPLHLPRHARLLMRAIVREEHMQQTALAMPGPTPSPRVPRWRPRFTDHRLGLDQVIDAWTRDAAG